MLDKARGQPQAIGHHRAAVAIVGTARGLDVEQAAGDIGVIDLAGVLVLQLVEAALATAVAQGLPLVAGERGDGLVPETA
jgi:hypothetical protein